MGALLRGVALGAVPLVLVACGSGGGAGERPCTLIGSREGIGLAVTAPQAARAADARMEVCWGGSCLKRKVVLSPSTTTIPQGCTGDGPDAVCGASASPDGGKHGFAPVPDLPESPVEITVTLLDAQGDRVLHKTITVTPEETHPNGPDCPPGEPQAQVKAGGGTLTEVP